MRLEDVLRDELGRIAPGLCDQGLALHIGNRVDLGIGKNNDLEKLRIERREMTDVRRRLRERRVALDGVGGRDRVAKTEVGFAFFDAAHVRNAGTWKRLHARPRESPFEHRLKRATKRHPGAALRAGHETDRIALYACTDRLRPFRAMCPRILDPWPRLRELPPQQEQQAAGSQCRCRPDRERRGDGDAKSGRIACGRIPPVCHFDGHRIYTRSLIHRRCPENLTGRSVGRDIRGDIT